MKYDISLSTKDDQLVMISNYCRKYKVPYTKIRDLLQYFTLTNKPPKQTDYINESILDWCLMDYLKNKRNLEEYGTVEYNGNKYSGTSAKVINTALVKINNPRKSDFTEERLEGIGPGMHWKHIKKLSLKRVGSQPDEKLQIMYLKDAKYLHEKGESYFKNEDKYFHNYKRNVDNNEPN